MAQSGVCDLDSYFIIFDAFVLVGVLDWIAVVDKSKGNSISLIEGCDFVKSLLVGWKFCLHLDQK